MFFKNCGQEIDDNAIICPHCGVATEKFGGDPATENAPVAKKTNVYAIVGFVLAVVGIVVEFVLSALVGLFIEIATLVVSIYGVIAANKKNQNLKGLAVAGIVLSAIGIVIFILLITVLAALIAGAAGAMS